MISLHSLSTHLAPEEPTVPRRRVERKSDANINFPLRARAGEQKKEKQRKNSKTDKKCRQSPVAARHRRCYKSEAESWAREGKI